MTVLPTETLASIRTEVARAANALEFSGTITTYTDTTHATDTGLSAYASADALKGLEFVPKGGTGAATAGSRLISASTVAGAMTFQKALAAALSTDTTYDIYRASVADKALLDLAIKHAIEQVQDWHLIDWEDVASVVLDSITKNGGFEDWDDGTAVAPPGFTLVQSGTTAAVARESTIILPPFRYSAKLTNELNKTAALRQQNTAFLYPWDYLGGDSVALSCLVYCTSATRAFLRLYDGTTTTDSTDHGGVGWQKLTVAATAIAANPTEISASLQLKTGAAISVYAHDFRIIPSNAGVYEYYLPKRFARIGKVLREDGEEFEWDADEIQAVWGVDPSRERLVFDRRFGWTAPGEYRVRLVGQKYQAVPSADADAIELPLPYIIASCRAFLAQMGRLKLEASEKAAIYGEAVRARRQLYRPPMPSSVRVR